MLTFFTYKISNGTGIWLCYFPWRFLRTEESQNWVTCTDALCTEDLLPQPILLSPQPRSAMCLHTAHLRLHCPLPVGLSHSPCPTFFKYLLKYHFLSKVHPLQSPERMDCFFISIAMVVCHIALYRTCISPSMFVWVSRFSTGLQTSWGQNSYEYIVWL